MKRIILSFAVVFAMSSFTTVNTNVEMENELPASCLMIAWNQIEAMEEELGYTLDMEHWTRSFKVLFDSCNDTIAGPQ